MSGFIFWHGLILREDKKTAYGGGGPVVSSGIFVSLDYSITLRTYLKYYVFRSIRRPGTNYRPESLCEQFQHYPEGLGCRAEGDIGTHWGNIRVSWV